MCTYTDRLPRVLRGLMKYDWGHVSTLAVTEGVRREGNTVIASAAKQSEPER
ncbi:hypothetical protein [Cyclobacterium jeungdonense]|uniref:Uncharacterized protein n=1 Tax=Cyclobacterium jeungdonense TaxID=708087 RepID=A0ABT8C951_9BACT|nr:hypothetical protein [Cyclobacterium jeungdonense]MDN3688896.1 hypothetical protein [Cyclobacterium jeungdonense]